MAAALQIALVVAALALVPVLLGDCMARRLLSAAVGIAVVAALIRGLMRRHTDRLGKFWVDLTRISLRMLLPLSFLAALLLVISGVIQNLNPQTAHWPHLRGRRSAHRSRCDDHSGGIETPGADLAYVAALMLDRHLDWLPIVEGHTVVGVITSSDLAPAAHAPSVAAW